MKKKIKKAQPDKKKDKRKAPRVIKEATVQYREKSNPTRVDITSTRNISTKGFLFTIDRYLAPGIVLLIRLRLPVKGDILDLEGRIVSCIHKGKGTIHQAGVEFINLDDTQKKTLKQFIQKWLEGKG